MQDLVFFLPCGSLQFTGRFTSKKNHVADRLVQYYWILQLWFCVELFIVTVEMDAKKTEGFSIFVALQVFESELHV